MALFPVQGIFEGDFVVLLVPVDTDDPMTVVDALLNSSFADLARRNSDEFLALLFTEFGVDAERSQDWPSALVRYALERRPELAEVLGSWLDTWQSRAFEAAGSLAAVFASAPAAMVPGEVADAVRGQHQAYLERCGLKSG